MTPVSGHLSTLPRPTPNLDRVTVFRLVLDDFPLEPGEIEILSDPAERYRLDDALCSTLDLDAITAEAVRVWRERRGQ